MSIDLVWQLSFIGGLVGFGIWFTYLSLKLNHTLGDVLNRGDDIDEIREAVEVVGSILQRLPELVPQFHTNQSPLQPIIEMFMSRMKENAGETLQTPQALRGSDGRFNGEGQAEEFNDAQTEI